MKDNLDITNEEQLKAYDERCKVLGVSPLNRVIELYTDEVIKYSKYKIVYMIGVLNYILGIDINYSYKVDKQPVNARVLRELDWWYNEINGLPVLGKNIVDMRYLIGFGAGSGWDTMLQIWFNGQSEYKLEIDTTPLKINSKATVMNENIAMCIEYASDDYDWLMGCTDSEILYDYLKKYRVKSKIFTEKPEYKKKRIIGQILHANCEDKNLQRFLYAAVKSDKIYELYSKYEVECRKESTDTTGRNGIDIANNEVYSELKNLIDGINCSCLY